MTDLSASPAGTQAAPDSAFDPATTALLIVDPYNDFLSEGGKLYGPALETLTALNTVEHMRQAQAAARRAGMRVFFAPHHRWCEGDYVTWKHLAPTQVRVAAMKIFAEGSWGGQFHPDFQPQPGDLVAQMHWMSSGFADTDLERLLRAHGVGHVIIIGMRANTCIESTLRYAAELGFRVTLIKDAIGAYTMDEIRSATEINGPIYAGAIITTADLVSALAPAG